MHGRNQFEALNHFDYHTGTRLNSVQRRYAKYRQRLQSKRLREAVHVAVSLTSPPVAETSTTVYATLESMIFEAITDHPRDTHRGNRRMYRKGQLFVDTPDFTNLTARLKVTTPRETNLAVGPPVQVQVSEEIKQRVQLLAYRSGEVRVRRHGDYLDVCLGTYVAELGRRRRVIVARFRYVDRDKVKVNGFDIVDLEDTACAGYVARRDLLLETSTDVKLWVADFNDNGTPVLEWQCATGPDIGGQHKGVPERAAEICRATQCRDDAISLADFGVFNALTVDAGTQRFGGRTLTKLVDIFAAAGGFHAAFRKRVPVLAELQGEVRSVARVGDRTVVDIAGATRSFPLCVDIQVQEGGLVDPHTPIGFWSQSDRATLPVAGWEEPDYVLRSLLTDIAVANSDVVDLAGQPALMVPAGLADTDMTLQRADTFAQQYVGLAKSRFNAALGAYVLPRLNLPDAKLGNVDLLPAVGDPFETASRGRGSVHQLLDFI